VQVGESICGKWIPTWSDLVTGAILQVSSLSFQVSSFRFLTYLPLPMSSPSFNQILPREREDGPAPEEIAAKRRKWIWITCLMVFVAGGIALGFNARKISRSVKGWQAERAARASETALAAKDYKVAQDKLQDALALSPMNPAANLAAARFLSTVGNSAAALGFYKNVPLANLTKEDQRQYATALIGSGNLAEAETQLRKAWPADTTGTPEDWSVALNMALQKRDEPAALQLAEKIMNSEVASSAQRFQTATLLANVPTHRDAAWRTIETLSRSPETSGLEALLALARSAVASLKEDPSSDTARLQGLIADIEKHPEAKIKHLLLVLDLRLLLDPSQEDTFIADAEKRFADKEENLEALTAWLYGKGAHEKVLTHLPPEIASRRRPLFLQRLDTLAALGRWQEVEREIGEAAFALDKVTAEMYLARCSEELGQKVAADNHWQVAVDAAGDNAQELLLVASYATRAGKSKTAQTAYQAAIDARGDFLPAFQGLLGILQGQRDTAGLNALLKRMEAQWPGEASVKNDLAYTSLLLQKDVEDSTRVAQSLFDKEPRSLPHRITLSLARLRAGDAAGAVALLDNLTGNLGNLESRKRAVQAAALWANDRKDEARTAINEVKRETLFAEEQALVSEVQ
jgi:Tfp pilus assembly protein PilF